MQRSHRWFGVPLLAGLLLFAGDRPEISEARRIGDEIRRTAGDLRPVEARLTLDAGWAPCAESPIPAGTGCSGLLRSNLTAPRCSPSLTRADPGFQELFRLFGSRKARDRDPAQASFSLFFKADEATTKAAIRTLENLGRNQEALSDLSAAYLHLAGLTGRPEMLLASLEAASEAVELRPDPPALFNRALVLSRLHLVTAARSAWEEYLEIAPADAWAAEAQVFLDRSAAASYQEKWSTEVEPALYQAALDDEVQKVREIVSQHRQRSREWAERDLLLEWASQEGEPAREALQIAGRIGDALAALGGDRMLAEGVKAISTASRESRERLRAGHRELAAGVDELYRAGQLTQVHDHFRRAQENLSASPFVLWTDFYLALVSYYQGDYDRAAASLEELKDRVDRVRHPVLTGRVLWIEGLTAVVTYRLEDASKFYGLSLQSFCTAGEEENVATVHSLLGEALSKMGRYEESWQHLYSSLARSDRIFDPIRHHAVLEAAILNAHRQGLDRAGLAFADEHLPVARSTGNPQILHYSLMHRARFRYELGDLPGAQADLAEAARLAGEIRDPNLRQRTAADFELVSAEIEAETNPRGAVSLLSRTIEQYERTGFSYLLPQAYGARSRAFRRLGNLAAAEQDLDREIQIFEGSADEIRRDVFRLSLLDQAAPTFDTMIALQATELVRPDLALEYSERSRYRAFLDPWAEIAQAEASRLPPVAPWATFDAQRLRDRLLEDTAVLEYTLLDDHLLTWIIRRSGIEMVAQTVKRPDLVRRIRRLERDLGDESVPPASRELYDLLVRPATPYLGGVSHLVIVPDKELFLVPFEALVDRRSDRILLEGWTISYAPSASLHVHLREAAHARSLAPERIVAATGALNGGFKYRRLPQALAEAHSIGALYPRGTILENPGKREFLTALSRAQILHFSGHAVPNGEQPFASRLVLADTPEAQVEIYAYELYDQTFPHLELVVLSACGTAGTSRPALGMAATLAGPFLAAGVPRVIGSQWRVEDEPTRRFFTAFHRLYAKGIGAADALRAAKLEFLRSGDPALASPRVWAAFVLVGG